jgi:hypothetical protein
VVSVRGGTDVDVADSSCVVEVVEFAGGVCLLQPTLQEISPRKQNPAANFMTLDIVYSPQLRDK